MSCIQEQPTEGVRPNAKENGQIRQSNTARTVGNVGNHPPSRIWASSQFRKRLPSTSVQGSSGESRFKPCGVIWDGRTHIAYDRYATGFRDRQILTVGAQEAYSIPPRLLAADLSKWSIGAARVRNRKHYTPNEVAFDFE